MHRDWDLVRRILLALEQKAHPTKLMRPEEIDGFDPILVSYHVKLLSQAGLIEAFNTSSINASSWAPVSLTWQGHEFLDSIRSQSMWQKVQIKAREKGVDLTLDVIIKIAKQLIDAAL